MKQSVDQENKALNTVMVILAIAMILVLAGIPVIGALFNI